MGNPIICISACISIYVINSMCSSLWSTCSWKCLCTFLELVNVEQDVGQDVIYVPIYWQTAHQRRSVPESDFHERSNNNVSQTVKKNVWEHCFHLKITQLECPATFYVDLLHHSSAPLDSSPPEPLGPLRRANTGDLESAVSSWLVCCSS